MNGKNKELLFSVTKNDFEVTFFSGKGAGGQYRNRHKNCVRIKHIATGVIATGQSERSLESNKKEAFHSMINNKKFKTWLKIETSKSLISKEERRKVEEEIIKKVDEMMDEKYLKVEYL